MIDDSCEVPREDLDEGFNPCRRQVAENGELCQYAHMYDVMNERYDREEDTSYLNSVKRDRISQSTPSQSTDGGKIYSQDTDGVEGFISTSGTLEPTTNAEIPSSKAVADYVAANIPDVSSLETEIDKKLNKVTIDSEYNQVYVKSTDGKQTMINVSDVGTSVTPTSGRLITGKGISEYAQPKAKVKDGLGTVSGCNASGDALDRVMVSNVEMSTASDGSSTIPSTGAVNIALATKQDKLTLPLSIEQGGTGGNTPYVTDDLDSSAIFVMHDAPNDRYDAAPMSALRNYLTTQFMSFDNESIPEGADLNTYKEPGNYSVRLTAKVPTVVNKPNGVSMAFNLYVVPILTTSSYTAQYLVEYAGGSTYYRHYSSEGWSSWNLLYPTRSTVPNPLPVDQGGTGAQTRSLKTAAGLTLLPVIDSIGASGALNGYTSVTNIATFITTNNIRPEITAAFENHIADSVADNDLLPTNALMIDYVDAHSMETPPGKFSFAVSPVPTGTWDGEMTINVVPVFATTIGSVTYVVARVYGSKRFNYTGSADNVNLFLGLKPVEEYTNALNSSTNIPLTLSVSGRSYTQGTYGFTPNGSTANLSLNNQIVSSVFNLGDFNISNNLKCVFGEGTNTPAVTVSVNCMALMWYSPM